LNNWNHFMKRVFKTLFFMTSFYKALSAEKGLL